MNLDTSLFKNNNVEQLLEDDLLASKIVHRQEDKLFLYLVLLLPVYCTGVWFFNPFSAESPLFSAFLTGLIGVFASFIILLSPLSDFLIKIIPHFRKQQQNLNNVNNQITSLLKEKKFQHSFILKAETFLESLPTSTEQENESYQDLLYSIDNLKTSFIQEDYDSSLYTFKIIFQKLDQHEELKQLNLKKIEFDKEQALYKKQLGIKTENIHISEESKHQSEKNYKEIL